MEVYSGGIAQIKENGGYINVGAGANVTFVSNSFSGLVLSSGQSATVHSGTTANSITVNSGGTLAVLSGGTALNVMGDGQVTADAGSFVTYANN